jgi:hypothetical protein
MKLFCVWGLMKYRSTFPQTLSSLFYYDLYRCAKLGKLEGLYTLV